MRLLRISQRGTVDDGFVNRCVIACGMASWVFLSATSMLVMGENGLVASGKVAIGALVFFPLTRFPMKAELVFVFGPIVAMGTREGVCRIDNIERQS